MSCNIVHMYAPRARRKLEQVDLDKPLTPDVHKGFHCTECRSSWRLPEDLNFTPPTSDEGDAWFCPECRDQYVFEQGGKLTALDSRMRPKSRGRFGDQVDMSQPRCPGCAAHGVSSPLTPGHLDTMCRRPFVECCGIPVQSGVLTPDVANTDFTDSKVLGLKHLKIA